MKALIILVASVLAFNSAPLRAAETPRIVEAFSCTFNSDQGTAELDSAIEYWLAQINRVGDPDLNRYGAGVLSPLRATFDGDFIWVGGYANLNAMARSLNVTNADPGLRQADARFDEVAHCDANLFFSAPIYTGTAAQDTAEDAVITLSACTLLDGKSLTDAEALESTFAALAKESAATVNLFRWVPFVANTPYDVVYLRAHRDLTTYAAFTTNLTTSDAGRQLGGTLAGVMQCEAGLFTGKLARRAAN